MTETKQDIIRKQIYKLTNETEQDITILHTLLCNLSYDDVILSLESRIKELQDYHQNNKTITIPMLSDLLVHIKALNTQRNAVLDIIRNTIYKCIELIPFNIYNIKESLHDLAHSIDSNNLSSLECGLARMKWALNTSSNLSAPIYTQEDLREEYNKGFETGYQRALKVIKEQQAASHLTELTIE